jgi:hypothetical protein
MQLLQKVPEGGLYTKALVSWKVLTPQHPEAFRLALCVPLGRQRYVLLKVTCSYRRKYTRAQLTGRPWTAAWFSWHVLRVRAEDADDDRRVTEDERER